MSAVETSSSGLTKKQKKAQAFRDRKRPGGKPPKPTPDDLPEMDVLEDAEEGEEDKVEVKQVKNGKATEGKVKEKGKGKGKEKQADAVADEDQEETEEKEKKKSKKEVNQRFILFVGEFSYS
jgi:nucleolar protein 6